MGGRSIIYRNVLESRVQVYVQLDRHPNVRSMGLTLAMPRKAPWWCQIVTDWAYHKKLADALVNDFNLEIENEVGCYPRNAES